MTWYTKKNNYIYIHVVAKPNAKKSQLAQISEQGLHISIKASPTDGKANKELQLFLSKFLNLPKSQVELKKGQQSRYKQVVIPWSEETWERLKQIEEENC